MFLHYTLTAFHGAHIKICAKIGKEYTDEYIKACTYKEMIRSSYKNTNWIFGFNCSLSIPGKNQEGIGEESKQNSAF